MTKVFVTSGHEAIEASWGGSEVAETLREYAALASRTSLELVGSPEDADVILFAESHRKRAGSGEFLDEIRASDTWRRFRERCFVHFGWDWPVPLVPGIYPSIPRALHRPEWTRPGPFLVSQRETNPYLESRAQEPDAQRDWLASFVGNLHYAGLRFRRAKAPRVRAALAQLDARRGFLVRESLESDPAGSADAYRKGFVDVVSRSRFALCPRGLGASTLRIFEAMQLGVAPVILSDAWVPPAGPDWERCSVRVAERDVARLPGILRAREPDALALGSAARQAWLDHFAPHSIFEWIVGQCLELRANGATQRSGSHALPWLQLGDPRRLYSFARTRLRGEGRRARAAAKRRSALRAEARRRAPEASSAR